jgi:hypothetical protein
MTHRTPSGERLSGSRIDDLGPACAGSTAGGKSLHC